MASCRFWIENIIFILIALKLFCFISWSLLISFNFIEFKTNTIGNVFGKVQIQNNMLTGITGMLNDYNKNTLKVFVSSLDSSLTATNPLSFQFVPAYTTDGTNNIVSMMVTNNTFSNWIGYSSSGNKGGIFLNLSNLIYSSYRI